MVTVSPDLAARLQAAAVERNWTHWINCRFYDETEGPCTCGIPGLLAQLAALLLEAPVSRAREAA